MAVTGKTARGKWWALAGVALSVLAVGMDLTVLSVALPTLAGALKASEPDLQWFSSGYALVLAAAMLPAGLLGDRYGRKKVMLWSLALFAAGSVACAFSRTPAQFIAARALLGLAGAGLVVMAVSALAVLFSEQERPKAVGVWAAANMVAFPVGPILGGWLLTHYWWGWVFLMNVPVALLGFVAVAVLVPESASPVRPGIDIVGVVSSSAGLVGVTFGLIQAGQHGWGSLEALVPLVLGLGVIVAFFSWERALGRRPGGQPLIDLSLFRSPAFTWGVIIFAILTLALIGLLFTLPQYFQGVLGTSPEAGVRLLPVVGGMLAGVVPAVPVVKMVGAKLSAAGGFVVLTAGLGLGATTTMSTTEGFVIACMAIVGAGAGCHHGHGRLGRIGRAVPGPGRGGVRGPPSAQEHGRAFRHRHPGQRPNLGLREPAPPLRAFARRRRHRTPEHLRRRGCGRRPAVAVIAPLRAGGVRARDGRRLLGIGGLRLAGLVLSLVFLPARARPPAAVDEEIPGAGRLAA